MGKIPRSLLYFSKGPAICSLLVSTLNPIEYSPNVLLHFTFPLPLTSWLRNVISFFDLSQTGLYSLLLLVCLTHALKSFIFMVMETSTLWRHLIRFLLLYNILIPLPPLLNFIQLALYLTLLWSFYNFAPIHPYLFNFTSNLIVYSSLFLPHCSHCPSLIYLHFKCYLPFFTLVL